MNNTVIFAGIIIQAFKNRTSDSAAYSICIRQIWICRIRLRMELDWPYPALGGIWIAQIRLQGGTGSAGSSYW